MRSVLVAGVALAVAAACDGSGDPEPASGEAQVYIATIREAMIDQPPPAEDPDVLPVIYVVGVGETPIAAGVQAEVAGQLREETDVRFADERAEAIDDGLPDAPVRDGGVLLMVGDVPADTSPIDVEIEIYRSADDWSRAVLTVEERSAQWSVTSSTMLDGP